MSISRRFFLKGSAAAGFASAFGLPAVPEAEESTALSHSPAITSFDSRSVIEATVNMHRDLIDMGGSRQLDTRAPTTTVEMRCIFDADDALLSEMRDMFLSGEERYTEFCMPRSEYIVCGQFRVTEFSLSSSADSLMEGHFTAVCGKGVEIRGV